jgi:hypothetical protein
MDQFPFTKREWKAVRAAAAAVAEASGPSQRTVRFGELKAALEALREKHGDHPVLLETEADFTSDPASAAKLYRAAELYAAANELPTLTIRLSLARVLVEELNQPREARAALIACREELPQAAATDCEAWNALMTECERLAPEKVGSKSAAR